MIFDDDTQSGRDPYSAQSKHEGSTLEVTLCAKTCKDLYQKSSTKKYEPSNINVSMSVYEREKERRGKARVANSEQTARHMAARRVYGKQTSTDTNQ